MLEGTGDGPGNAGTAKGVDCGDGVACGDALGLGDGELCEEDGEAFNEGVLDCDGPGMSDAADGVGGVGWGDAFG